MVDADSCQTTVLSYSIKAHILLSFQGAPCARWNPPVHATVLL